MQEFISKSSSVNLIIIGITIIAVVLIIIKAVKELNFKFGDKAISFSSRKTQTAIVKVVTDYADFKYKIKEEQNEGIQDLHTQARRITAIHLDQYIRHITTDYINALNTKKVQDKSLTINIFTLLIRLLYNEMFHFCMDIYEKNHLKDKTDNELKECSELNYLRLADIFREFMQTNWMDVMGSYETLHEVCVKETDFVKNLVFQILESYRDLSRQKYELINTINDIDCKVRRDVQNNGALPVNAISILSDLYIPGSGLNKNSVKNWLSTNK